MKPVKVMMDGLTTALAPAIWGSTYLVTTEMLPPDSPLLASAIRALPAGLILLMISRQLPTGQWWWRALVLGILNIGAFFYFLFVAAYHLPGGVAALVMSCQPIIVLLLGTFLLGQKIRNIQVFACLVGAFGVGMLVLTPAASYDAVGIFAGLAGAASMATGIVLAKRWGRPEGVGLLTLTGWQLTVGGVLLLPIALVSEGIPDVITGINWIGFAYLSIIGALFAYVIWFRGLERLPAVSVSFISFASPLAATALGYIVLNQGFTAAQGVGALGIVISIIMAQLPPKKIEPVSHQELQLDSQKR